MTTFLSNTSGHNPVPATVQPEELISRYIFHTKQYKKTTREVAAAAFLPNKKDNETSVFRINDLEDREIWGIGVDHVEMLRKKADPRIILKARGDLTALAAINQELKVIPEVSLHPLHANLSSWPDEESAKNMVAIELALASTLHMRPEII